MSSAQAPKFKGLETFQGTWYHTGHWPHEGVDFTGQRVGVIGTGSSAIQSIPIIAEQAAHLLVFQRTPNYSVPARNAPMDPDYQRRWKNNYAEHRRQARESRIGFVVERNEASALEVPADARQREYETRWDRGGLGFSATFVDLLTSPEANETAAAYFHAKIRGIVRDPAVAEALLPRDYPLGTKRLCVDTNYYDTFNRPNVTLVDIRKSPIDTIVSDGVRTRDAGYTVDSLVFAIGFDAMTGALLSIDIRGRGGRTLQEKWAAGPRTYLGLAIAGFPNLFTITGPGSPSVSNRACHEQHVDWIADACAPARAPLDRIAATSRRDAWVPRQRGPQNEALSAATTVPGRQRARQRG